MFKFLLSIAISVVVLAFIGMIGIMLLAVKDLKCTQGVKMAASAAQRKATDKWQKENYEFIKIRLNKGEKEIIKAKADAEGKSLNEFIRNKIL